MTMLKRKNWDNDERWYVVPVSLTREELAEVDDDEEFVENGFRRVAHWDRITKVWISYIVNGKNYQVGDADFYANKRTFMH